MTQNDKKKQSITDQPTDGQTDRPTDKAGLSIGQGVAEKMEFFFNKDLKFRYLVACTRLYNPLCPFVGRSVCQSAFFAAPAHLHATKVAVYPALLNQHSTNTDWKDL